MQTKHRVNSIMLRLARESREITQKDLAIELGIDQPRIAKMEQGLIGVSDILLRAISKALSYPMVFFYQEGHDWPDALVYHRKRKTIPKKRQDAWRAQMNILGLIIDRLLESVDIETSVPNFPIDGSMNPTSIGKEIRKFWDVPRGPLQEPIRHIEDSGVIVVEWDFGSDKVDGRALYTDGGHPVIVLNQRHRGDRQKYTAVHEYVHTVRHFKTPPTSVDDAENEANGSCAEVLMPEDEIRNQLFNLNIRELADLKRYWKVSMASLLVRAKTLRTINSNQERYMWMRMAKAGYKTNEPKELDFPKEKPTLLRDIISAHLADLGYNEEQLAEYLCLTEEEFRDKFLGNQRTKIRIVR